MYKVIKEATWLKRGKAVHFHSYVRANSIIEATKLAADRWGLDNIKEVVEC
jgi:hypothetical protein